ncbi:MAG: CBS domain-containing protein [Candidatus Micrarchaeota archaeon]|nr:CBS domain-containing protein [Candidatus Micrarchaeota archaeon]
MHGITLVNQEATILEIAKLMERKGIGSVLVETRNGVNGILTERDILKKVVAAGLDPSVAKAKQAMTKMIKTVGNEADIFEANELFNRYNIRRLPVTDSKGKIIGIITIGDVTKSLPYAFRKLIRDEDYRGAVVFSKKDD